ncbi:MAG: LuxR C-terminal-related transcriptional regulator [Bifidobacteriaceae bacterium]|jgi:DNA-binding CsgD family transcriptional regulator|nr:LuxR C-terminal-related transcriptional regulator [Bifidobacteriaceae bacterium]
MLDTQQSRLFTLVRKRASAILGLSLFWAWTSASFYCLLLLPQLDDAARHARDIWIWTSWAQALTFLLAASLSRSAQSLLRRQHSLLITTAIAAIGTAFIPLSSLLADTNGALALYAGLAGAALTGCAGACLILIWADELCGLGEQMAVLTMNCALIASAALYFAVVALPPALAIAGTVALPIVSGIMLASLKAKQPHPRTIVAGSERRKRRSKKVILPLAVAFLCAVMGEVFRNLITSVLDDAGFRKMGGLYVAGGSIGVVLLSAMLWALTQNGDGAAPGLLKREGLAMRTVLLTMVLGLAITALFDASLFLGYGFFCAAFCCLRALSWMYSVRIVILNHSSVPLIFGVSMACFSLPVALSASVMPRLTSAIANSVIPWASVIMVAITLLFLLAVFVLDPKDVSTNWGLTPSSSRGSLTSQDQEPVRHFLRQERGLTERELEVALLLGKGRSLPFIQRELYIAEGTASTHLRHIYQKLGVHNRQELITALELAANGQP